MNVKLNVPEVKKQLAMQGLTNTALAIKVGMSRQNVSTVLKRGTCSGVNAGKLARALGVDVREIWKED